MTLPFRLVGAIVDLLDSSQRSKIDKNQKMQNSLFNQNSEKLEQLDWQWNLEMGENMWISTSHSEGGKCSGIYTGGG